MDSGKIIKAIIVILAAAVLIAPSPCFAQGEVAVAVTREFSQPPLVSEKVSVAGGSCMDVLKSCARVETAYGGGFVVSINGIKGGRREGEWFYYVNGIMADVGADRYPLRAGDVVQWDLHPWNSSATVSAIIGSYPQPFLSGGCRILYSREMKEPTGRLAGGLRSMGVTRVSVAPLERAGAPAGGPPVIIVGACGALREVGWVADLFNNPGRAGLFLDFGEAGMTVLGFDGRPAKTFPGAGAIVAVKRGYGSSAGALWLITGTDGEGVLRALELLLDRPGRVAFLSGAAVTRERVENVPLP